MTNNRAGWALAAVIVAWATTITLIAVQGGFDGDPGRLPAAIIVAVLAPLAVFAVLYRTVEGLRQVVLRIPLPDLILIHSWRMLGLAFVFVYYAGQLPAEFSLPAGLGDAGVAVGATVLAARLYRGESVPLGSLRLWNVIGVLDFLLAVSLGTLTRQTWLGNEVTSHAMGTFPLVIIPGFIVPLYLITHAMIWMGLRKSRGEETAPIVMQ